ncbi:MAG TPA: DUF1003 domain-containing protein [Cyclobacteriaceae bacterium]|nr:DUF1003 domain-containing protein [Cyclobacteriaceae bacterium]
METFISDLSRKEYPITDQVSGKLVRKSILELICRDYPQFTTECKLAISELNVYRQKYIASFLAKEIGELTELEETVLGAMQSKQTLVDKIEDVSEELTLGQRLADVVASFGGSWKFIVSFAFFISFWIGINAAVLAARAFDPYPFILLNLILSCVAALQAPIIMMSQNRQEEKDRSRAKKDYMINLKSELEIRMVHEKLDHLIMHQQQELIEIQKVQVEMMNDIMDRLGDSRKAN